MYTVSQAHWLPETDAHATLQTLREQGYRLGLISNAGDDADVQTLVDKAGLRSYFDTILTSAAMGIRKPNPRIFLAALEHWGYRPSQAAMVGDSLGADILGARNAGLFSVWITRRAETAANHAHGDTIQPDAMISTLSELPEFLRTLEI
jgi:HAD superfamily hydrolase (TIGR01662 family)